ncbi:MAG TPA: TM1802 family CRISPR-associated protein, partial [Nitrososphaeraceae archaeon]|nr:TM1802 family CRISPR-associated protein [Nitrososphaeraceae archaeon]
MIHKAGDESAKFVAQIKDYTEFFRKGILSKFQATEKLICSCCNKTELIEIFVEKPLPFYVSDKPMFFPDTDSTQAKKGFPI